MAKYIAGDDLKGWADYAKRNSYQCDKAALKHNVGTEGAAADLRINEAAASPLKPHYEGRGWAKAKATTSGNAYTGPGGSKRNSELSAAIHGSHLGVCWSGPARAVGAKPTNRAMVRRMVFMGSLHSLPVIKVSSMHLS